MCGLVRIDCNDMIVIVYPCLFSLWCCILLYQSVVLHFTVCDVFLSDSILQSRTCMYDM